MGLFMPPLEPGERVVWRAWKSLSRCALGVFVSFVAWVIFNSFASVLGVVAVVAVLYWFCVHGGVRFVLTDRRVVRIDGFGRSHAMPLAELRDYHQFQVSVETSSARYRRKNGVSYFNVLFFTDGAGAKLVFEYPGDSETLDEIMHAHLDRRVLIEHLPAIGVRPADAYRRADVFFARRCFIEGDEYGPLFIGSGLIVRFRSALSRANRIALERLVASHLTDDALEAAVKNFQREECPSLSWTWQDAEVRVTERGLIVPIDRGFSELTLAPDDLARLRQSRFGYSARSVHR